MDQVVVMENGESDLVLIQHYRRTLNLIEIVGTLVCL